MSHKNCFASVASLNLASTIVFWLVVGISIALLKFTDERFLNVAQPLLVVLSIAGVVLGGCIRFVQTAGNEDLRLTQLTNAFEVSLGAPPPEGYYNNPLGPSTVRLAVTTLENTKFSAAILKVMLTRKRFWVVAYAILFVLLMSYRHTSLGLITIIAQTIFSGDIILNWILTERFRWRAVKARDTLRSHFATAKTDLNSRADTAVFLAAFANYECAKDEAAVSLDSAVFEKLNPELSREWEEEMARLGILDSLKSTAPSQR